MTSPTGTLTSAAAPAPLRPTAVLLDLDGTITDSGAAITTSIVEALTAFGYPAPAPDQLRRFVGPPIRVGLTEIGGVRAADLEDVVEVYRATYTGRMLDVDVYPGMPELVRALHDAGLPLALATSKLLTMASPILEGTGLAQCFTAVCGATDARSTKAEVVQDALAALRAAGADVTGAVMVGDRHHDVEGAAAHGVPAVLAGWGYGHQDEADGAYAVAADAAELAALLGVAVPVA
ncbi:HAD hydrolase-like protein [Georgenia sp. AZ-5]|uniref:HAD hydrolase-like protein n=1 Tax=Georgenia sp. AZ-5 TaxID=3367526 RepID=UPI003755011F